MQLVVSKTQITSLQIVMNTFFFSVSVEVQRWHGGHYMVSGGNDRLDGYNLLSVYIFFSQCFGQMSESVKEDLHYVFVERDTLTPVILFIYCVII